LVAAWHKDRHNSKDDHSKAWQGIIIWSAVATGSKDASWGHIFIAMHWTPYKDSVRLL
jgi:hypothetical protein